MIRANKTPPNRDFVRVGRSKIQGTGLFAKRNIPKGTRIIEYLGARVPLVNLLVDITNGAPSHVYAFRLNASTVIDGSRNGNEARFINHSCAPNCEAYMFDERMYIYAMREIVRGEELTFDYQLGPAIKKRRTKKDMVDYACHCGSKNCRGTMLAVPKRTK